MAAGREVKVHLKADVAEYEAAMKKAAKRARKLSRALREVNEITIRIHIERT